VAIIRDVGFVVKWDITEVIVRMSLKNTAYTATTTPIKSVVHTTNTTYTVITTPIKSAFHTTNTTYTATTGSLNTDWATKYKAKIADSKTNLKILLCVLIRPT